MSGVRKSFGPTRALDGVDLEVQGGEVLALVGENGAGKSTLMKILSGAERADGGTMTLDGKPFAPRGPDDARRRGVAMVYQELTLAPHLSVEANVLLGIEPSRWGVLDRGEGRRRVAEALRSLEHPEIDPDSPVWGLSPAARQVVEIARALLLDVKLLVLDEPTSSLTQEDAQRLFDLVVRLRWRGVSVVYISHFLEEIQRVADRVTVLRDGRAVATDSLARLRLSQIIELMIGRTLSELYPQVPHEIGEPVLEVRDLQGENLPRGVSFTLRRGEILGLAGIVGAGRTELLRALYALDPVRSGEVKLHSVSGKGRAETPASRIERGVGLVSEDRKAEGLALGRSVADNVTLSKMTPYSTFGWLNLFARSRAVSGWLARLGVRCSGPAQPVGELSGGNQQKVAIGRLLHQDADVLLLDEPTRGVDVGSKAEIYRLMGEMAAQGKAIVFVSSYLPELLGVCDTLAVMARGRMSEVRPAGEWSADDVLAFATGATVRRGGHFDAPE
jgi:ribose transport system ATP-binding protein